MRMLASVIWERVCFAAPKEKAMEQLADMASDGVVGAEAAHMKVHPVTLSIYALRANQQIQITLSQDATACWGDAFVGNRRVGVSLAASVPGALLHVNRFIVNKKSVLLSNNEECAEIRIRLYIHHVDLCVTGSIDLPPGAHMEIESLVDRVVNVQGSFSLILDR
ncbi:hypothetical protein C0Z19_14525 [Trinickia soli]|uniref:Uncharacterized protein n=2 Tax=Trinickia soli TaxID=380675 RepID=A0A2N7W3S0_9BURK|nr:hypothetical protein C0Z19_14525 [Trinickia soli]